MGAGVGALSQAFALAVVLKARLAPVNSEDQPLRPGEGSAASPNQASPRPVAPALERGALAWIHVRRMQGGDLGYQLRTIIELLYALAPLHLVPTRPVAERCHGALQPGCVLVCLDGTVRLLWDAQTLDGQNQSVYLAPEVQAGREPTPRSDLYSVGVMLYETLAGRPLQVRLAADVHAAERPRVPAWAEPLFDVAIRALYRTPHQRWATATEFAEQILRMAGPHIPKRAELAALVRSLVARDAEIKLTPIPESWRRRVPGFTPSSQPPRPSLPVWLEKEPTAAPSLVPVPETRISVPSLSDSEPVRTSGYWYSRTRLAPFARHGLILGALLALLLIAYVVLERDQKPEVPSVAVEVAPGVPQQPHDVAPSSAGEQARPAPLGP